MAEMEVDRPLFNCGAVPDHVAVTIIFGPVIVRIGPWQLYNWRGKTCWKS